MFGLDINKLESAYQYADDVKSGKILVNKYIRLAVERFHRDLANQKDSEFYFDETAAQKAVSFFDLLCFTKGKWKGLPFKLEPWQAFMVANIFGWKRNSNNYRRITEAYISVPKKNGKTEVAAGIGLLMLLIDNEGGAEVYAAAATRDQAGICFKAAKSMARASRFIKKHLEIYAYSILHSESDSTMSAVSHDADNTEGKFAHCVLFDEYHVHKTDDVKTSLRSGMAAREQPLFFTITTAGANLQGPCFKYQKTCIDVLEEKVKDRENMFAMIFGLDEGDNWEDPAMWRKANPNYNVSVRPEFLKDEYKKAKTNGREEVEFKTKHLNMWVGSDVTWIPAETWKTLADPEKSIKRGSIWYGGLDLGQTRDISSFAMFFPKDMHLIVRHYCSEKAAENAVRGGIDYMEWAEKGYLTLTPGKTTNYNWIKKDIYKAAEEYELQFLGYDQYSSSHFRDELNEELGETYTYKIEDGGRQTSDYFPKLETIPQNFERMAPPTRIFEEMVINGEFTHDGNPVTAWMLGNCATRTDPNGRYTVSKKNSKDKVDGIVASIMAFCVWKKWHYTNDEIEDYDPDFYAV